ncbi:hypothetical protein JT358_07760 [Micrococcales bacterium 31B]|nr:hypothetical protein [Micrococcales bacterium 31B]
MCLAVLFAALVACGLAFLSLNNAVNGSWNMPSQTWDAVLHANSVRFLIESGNAGPFGLRYAPFVEPAQPVFYPSTFYQLAGAVVTFTGADPITATNIAAFLIAGWIFPLGMAFFVSCLAPHRPHWQPVALLLGPSLWAFPWAPLGWGVLWPSAISIAMIPFALGALVRVFHSGSHVTRLQRGAWMLLAILGASLTALSHPRGAVLLVIASGIYLLNLGIRSVLWRRRGDAPQHRALRIAAGVMLLVLPAVTIWGYYQLTSDRFSNKVTNIFWPIRSSPMGEVWNYLIQGPENSKPAYVLGALIALGVLCTVVRPRYAWLSVGYLVFAWLDITAATTHDESLLVITQIWYNDRHRIVGVTAVFAIGLMCLALHAISVMSVRVIQRAREARAPLTGRQREATLALQPAILATLVAVMFVSSSGLNVLGHVQYLSQYYRDAQNTVPNSLVSASEQQFMESLSTFVSPDEVVVNMPGDGSPMLYAISGLEPLFPLTNTLSGNSTIIRIAQNLTAPGQLPGLCADLERLNAPWLLTAQDVFHTDSVSPFDLPTLRVTPGDPNFTPVARGGDMTLYRITGCFPPA